MTFFKDEKLQSYFEKMINQKTMIKQDLTLKRLRSYTFLSLSYQEIEYLDGIENCENLERLVLINNPIVDLSPLNHLPKLQFLDLSSLTRGVFFNTLKGPIKSIEQLCIRSVCLEDVDWVSYFPNLKHLSILDNQVRSIEPLFQLDHLITVDLRKNPISNDEIESLVNQTGASLKF